MFHYQLFILKLFGYQLEYPQTYKGIFMICWGYLIWACTAFGALTAYHAFATSLHDVKLITASLTSALNWTLSFVRLCTLFIRRNRLRVLIQDLQSSSVDNMDTFAVSAFRRAARRSQWYSNIVLLMIIIPMFKLIVEALYNVVILRLKILPYRVS